MRKLLFVCTANLQRSPTAESLFQSWKRIWEVKSAGTTAEPGCIQLTQELIDWADVIIVMEETHRRQIETNYACDPDKVCVLDIPDRFYRNDLELVRLLRLKVPPVLDRYEFLIGGRKRTPHTERRARPEAEVHPSRPSST